MCSYILLGLLSFTSAAMAGTPTGDDRPAEGEAYIRYLGHAGWLVRTSEHYLIFDYTGTFDYAGPVGADTPDRGLLSGEQLAGQPVVLFVSHGHGDHFNRAVLDLRDSVDDLVVVMGWDEPTAAPAVVPPDAEWVDVSGAQVFTLHHDYDGIPEGFFLVRSGGVALYHSGDHGTWSEPPNETFRANIDRMAAASEGIDIAFISSFGRRRHGGALNPGDIYSIRTLEPSVTFPMHRGGLEHEYTAFSREVSALELPTTVGVATEPGASFLYQNGALHKRRR